MPNVRKSVLLPYSAEQMYELVERVERYPEFLPWCDKARVIEHDDEYRGYRIPKGATVSTPPSIIWHIAHSDQIIPNVWSILHDEERYSDPLTFKPDRFEGKSKKDVGQNELPEMAFGFGRRLVLTTLGCGDC